LEAAGVPTAFAGLLVGRDNEDTDARAEQFCAAYQAAVTEDIRKRLPQQAPDMRNCVPARKARRGITLLHG